MNDIEASRHLYDIADLIEPLESGLGMTGEGRLLRQRADQLRSGLYNLLVVGSFSNGKSTIVNALLGEEIVLTGAVPTTAVVTKLSKSESRSIMVHPRTEHPYPIDEDRYLKKFDVNTIGSEDEAIHWTEVEHIDITGPFHLLEDGCTLVDTPGLAENRLRTGLALNYLPHASAIIMVFNARQFFSRDERDFISILGTGKLTHLFFVVNKIDLVTPEEFAKLEQYVQQRLSRYFYDENGRFDKTLFEQRVFFTDAESAISAIKEVPPNQQLYYDSGVGKLRDKITEYLYESQTTNSNLHILIPFLANILAHAEQVVAQRLDVLVKPLHTLEESASECDARLQRLQTLNEAIQQKIIEFGEIVKHRIYTDLLQYTEVMKKNWPEDVHQLELNEVTNVNVFSAKFKEQEQQQFATALSRELQRYIQRQLISWAKQLPASLQADVEGLFDDIEQELRYYQIELQDIAHLFSSDDYQTKPRTAEINLLPKNQNWFNELFSQQNILHLIRPTADKLLHDLFDDDAYKTVGLSVVRNILEVVSAVFGYKGSLFGWLFSQISAELVGTLQRRHEMDRLAGNQQPLELDKAYADLGNEKVTQLQSAIRDTLTETLQDSLFTQLHDNLVSQREAIFERIDAEFLSMKKEVSRDLQEAIDNLRTTQQHLLDKRRNHNFSLEEEEQRLQTIKEGLKTHIDTISMAVLQRPLQDEEIELLSQRRAIFLEQAETAPEIIEVVDVITEKEAEPPVEVTTTQTEPLTSERINKRLMGVIEGALGLGHAISNDSGIESISQQLASMIGLDVVKDRILELMALQNEAQQRRQSGYKESLPSSLHLVFTGNPGTGKTTVAEIVGKMYKRLGLLKKGHVVSVTRTDLVGMYQGFTERNTQKAVQQALDGILFIDEAYSLSAEFSGSTDIGKFAIETIMHSMEALRDRLVVIVAGYPKEMDSFLKANPGLMSRFPPDNVIHFPDYSPAELQLILEKFLTQEQYALSETAVDQIKLVVEGLYAQRDKNFGNAREMRNFAEALIRSRAVRRMKNNLPIDEPIQAEDINAFYRHYISPTVDKVETADTILADINRLVGLESVKESLTRLVARANVSKRLGEPIQADTLHMVFRGPPGTGKTTVAEYMGKILRALGFLEKGHLTVTDRSNFVGPYIGQTEERTQKILEDALHGVLFIDEAYSLYTKDSPRDFGHHVINQLTGYMDRNRSSLVVILAGYPDEIDELLDANPGLKDRFRTPFDFPHYSQDDLLAIGRKMCADDGYRLTPEAEADMSIYLERKQANNPRAFGNARAVRVLLDEMKDRLAMRISLIEDDETFRRAAKQFEAEDVPSPPNQKRNQGPQVVIIDSTSATEQTAVEQVAPLKINIVPPMTDRSR